MDENFYAAPEADLTTPQHGLVEALAELNYKQLRKLYHRSINIRTLNFLICIAAIFMGFSVVGLVMSLSQMPSRMVSFLIIFILIFILELVTFIGVFLRADWGRFMGIICSILIMLNFPVGTLFGIAGLFAFFGAPELFGPDRIKHAEVRKEFKHRKRNKFFN